jgi:YihY family inner membrane protein
MNALKQAVTAADRFQSRRPPLAFPVAVWKKFGDDKAGYLAALIAYYGFVALFPLLLVLITVLSLVLRDDPALQKQLLDSALAEYPVIGPQLRGPHGLQPISATGISLVIGLVFLLLGARGLAGAMQESMWTIWAVDKEERPGFPWVQLRGLGLVLIIGAGFLVTTTLAGLAGGASHLLGGAVAQVATIVVGLVLNVGMFWLGFHVATAGRVRWRDQFVGPVVAAVVWEVLQLAGGYLVAHQLHRASELYGSFSLVLGLLAWLYLQAQVTLYAAEIDVVLVRRLWPRSLVSDNEGQVPSRSDEQVPSQRVPSDERRGKHAKPDGERADRDEKREENAGSSA